MSPDDDRFSGRPPEPPPDHAGERDWRGPEDNYRPPATSGKAIASLVLGIASLICSVVTGLPAILFAILGLRDIKRSDGRLTGSGLAIAGLVLGIVGTVLSIVPVLLILIGLLVPAVQKVREAATSMKTSNNLKEIGIAMHNYEANYGTLPPAAITDKDGKPLLSWRVALLPYLEQDNLYKQFKLDEPWDSSNNKPLLAQMPKVYDHPAARTVGSGDTFFQVFTGSQTAFPPGRGLKLTEITDGLSNTVLVAEAATGVPWTKPEDLAVVPGQPLPPLGGHLPQGYNLLFADASVRRVPKNFSEQTLRKLITPNGNETIGPAELP
jgi:Protein of unknown function (DUF1559)/Domain of unknown function (DUF4190)